MTLLDGGSKESLAERWNRRNYQVKYIALALIMLPGLLRSYEKHDGSWWKWMLVGAGLLAVLIWRRPRAPQV
jgi:hypothetical protein